MSPKKISRGHYFKGGKKKQRDKWFGFHDKQFQRWWHRQGKREYGGRYDIESRESAEMFYQIWVELGKPRAK